MASRAFAVVKLGRARPARPEPFTPGSTPVSKRQQSEPSERPRLPVTLYPVIKGVVYNADGAPLVTREHENGRVAASTLHRASPVDQLLSEALRLYRSN